MDGYPDIRSLSGLQISDMLLEGLSAVQYAVYTLTLASG
jgi:hypothetical protein